jgi:hypothetical protein
MVGKISFAGVKTTIDPIPDGIYECQFVGYKFGKTGQGAKNPGEDKVDLQFAVTGNVPGEELYKNRRLWRSCTFGADSLWAFKSTMEALGTEVDWEDPEGIDPQAVCQEVKDNLCQIKVLLDSEAIEDQVTHEKKPGNKITGIIPTDSMKLYLSERAHANAAVSESEPEPEHTSRRHN